LISATLLLRGETACSITEEPTEGDSPSKAGTKGSEPAITAGTEQSGVTQDVTVCVSASPTEDETTVGSNLPSTTTDVAEKEETVLATDVGIAASASTAKEETLPTAITAEEKETT
jgi:hypothetical protein